MAGPANAVPLSESLQDAVSLPETDFVKNYDATAVKLRMCICEERCCTYMVPPPITRYTPSPLFPVAIPVLYELYCPWADVSPCTGLRPTGRCDPTHRCRPTGRHELMGRSG